MGLGWWSARASAGGQAARRWASRCCRGTGQGWGGGGGTALKHAHTWRVEPQPRAQLVVPRVQRVAAQARGGGRLEERAGRHVAEVAADVEGLVVAVEHEHRAALRARLAVELAQQQHDACGPGVGGVGVGVQRAGVRRRAVDVWGLWHVLLMSMLPPVRCSRHLWAAICSPAEQRSATAIAPPCNPTARTYLAVAAVQHVAQLHQRRVAPDPVRPALQVAQHARDLQRLDCLCEIAVDVADCRGEGMAEGSDAAACVSTRGREGGERAVQEGAREAARRDRGRRSRRVEASSMLRARGASRAGMRTGRLCCDGKGKQSRNATWQQSAHDACALMPAQKARVPASPPQPTTQCDPLGRMQASIGRDAAARGHPVACKKPKSPVLCCCHSPSPRAGCRHACAIDAHHAPRERLTCYYAPRGLDVGRRVVRVRAVWF